MEPEFWRQRWRDQQTGFHLDQVNPQLVRYAPELALAPGATVFVPLCGKSLDVQWFAQQGHAALGVELSPLAVETFFDERGLRPVRRVQGRFELWEHPPIRILCGDFFDLEPGDLNGVSAFYDRASLIALPPAMRERYGAHLTRLLPAPARGLLITLDYNPAELDGPPFPVRDAEVHALYRDRFTVRQLDARDALADNPRFRERGLSRMEERVYLLSED
ncbi:MAG: thiopurine S-methyltransferase [Chromatiales bacterium 21-64-14]|nr:MAG: thiopurine S-methyltransferase [Chromatiales bacterium 21-64-14]HQU15851.1 thiopurine S-methyltransferase [Gammaproteobacteria bacterium]